MLSKAKRAIINTPLQPFAEQALLHPVARFRGLLKPELREMYQDDIHLDRLIEKIVKPNHNCIDLGCHIGSILAKFVRLAPQGAHMAVEPTPEKATYLKQKFPTVDVRQLALSDEPGEAKFFINAKASGYNSLNKRTDEHTGSEEITVEVDTLDRLISGDCRIDIIKMDVEGAELRVLKGGRECLARNRPIVIFESGPASPMENGARIGDDLFQHFEDVLGYEIYSPHAMLHGGVPMTLDEHRDHRTYPFAGFNFVAKPK